MEVGSRNAEVGVLKLEVGMRKKKKKQEGEKMRRWEGGNGRTEDCGFEKVET